MSYRVKLRHNQDSYDIRDVLELRCIPGADFVYHFCHRFVSSAKVDLSYIQRYSRKEDQLKIIRGQ